MSPVTTRAPPSVQRSLKLPRHDLISIREGLLIGAAKPARCAIRTRSCLLHYKSTKTKAASVIAVIVCSHHKKKHPKQPSLPPFQKRRQPTHRQRNTKMASGTPYTVKWGIMATGGIAESKAGRFYQNLVIRPSPKLTSGSLLQRPPHRPGHPLRARHQAPNRRRVVL